MKYLLCILFFIIPLTLHAEAVLYTPERPLKIGAILPLSGNAASIGQSAQKAMLLALDQMDDADRNRVTIFFEDDALNARMAVSAFHKLRAQHKIDVLVNLSSGTGNALAPLAEQHTIPFLAIASDPKVVSDRKYVFNFWVTPEEQARVLIPEALRRGYKNIAVITTIHDGSYAVKSAFDTLNEGQLNLAFEEEVDGQNRDFRTLIAQIRRHKNIDAIMPILFPGQLSMFAVQARQLGVDSPFFGYEFFEDRNEIKLAQGALEGAWYVNAEDPTGSFTENFKERFPEASLYAAGNAHDSILLFAVAARGASNSDQIVHFLRTLKDFSGAMGTYSASGDNRFALPAALKEVRGEGFVTLNPGSSN